MKAYILPRMDNPTQEDLIEVTKKGDKWVPTGEQPRPKPSAQARAKAKARRKASRKAKRRNR
jgi:hypothetical protein